MTKAQASSAAGTAITAGYQVSVTQDGLGVWHLLVQPAPGGSLTAALVSAFATANSITNANVGSADLF